MVRILYVESNFFQNVVPVSASLPHLVGMHIVRGMLVGWLVGWRMSQTVARWGCHTVAQLVGPA